MNKLLCKVVLLANSSKPQKPYLWTNIDELKRGHHLYLISDREIKEGDWFVLKNKDVYQHIEGQLPSRYTELRSRIEATTDKSLGLALIPHSFIEEYIQKQGNVDRVCIRMSMHNPTVVASEGTLIESTVIILPVKDSWNREEVRTIALAAAQWGKDREIHYFEAKDSHLTGNQLFNDWFNKNY